MLDSLAHTWLFRSKGRRVTLMATAIVLFSFTSFKIYQHQQQDICDEISVGDHESKITSRLGSPVAISKEIFVTGSRASDRGFSPGGGVVYEKTWRIDSTTLLLVEVSDKGIVVFKPELIIMQRKPTLIDHIGQWLE